MIPSCCPIPSCSPSWPYIAVFTSFFCQTGQQDRISLRARILKKPFLKREKQTKQNFSARSIFYPAVLFASFIF